MSRVPGEQMPVYLVWGGFIATLAVIAFMCVKLS